MGILSSEILVVASLGFENEQSPASLDFGRVEKEVCIYLYI